MVVAVDLAWEEVEGIDMTVEVAAETEEVRIMVIGTTEDPNNLHRRLHSQSLVQNVA